jgi:DNA-binding MarR family transcriptional regulator
MEERLFQNKVLETLWEAGKPLKPQEIAETTGLGFSTLITHLQSLVKAGYVSTPKRGFYAITADGKEKIGITEAERKRASTILSPVPLEKAFRFYKGASENLGVYASSLNDFCKKIKAVDLSSIEFHLFRKDFESWIRGGLGDSELANRIGMIRTMGLSSEDLRQKLYETIESRCRELEDLLHGSS